MAATLRWTHRGLVQDRLKDLRHEVRKSLKPVQQVTDTKLLLRLSAHAHALSRQRIPWLAELLVHCYTAEARNACSEKLLYEVHEYYRGTFKRFMHSIAYMPKTLPRWHGSAKEQVNAVMSTLITNYCKDHINGLLAMAALEAASIQFTPWLEKAAKQLGATELAYTQRQAQENRKHAAALFEAVVAEAQDSGMSPDTIYNRDIVPVVTQFICGIFTAR